VPVIAKLQDSEIALCLKKYYGTKLFILIKDGV
jgi:hypothetical protein